MDGQHATGATTERHGPTGPARLRGRQPLLVRGAWLALIAVVLTISLVTFPAYLAQLQTPCAGFTCQYQQLTPDQVVTLEQAGLSLDWYAVAMVVLMLASVAVCWGVSALIVWRRPNERIAILVALLLVALGPLGVVFALPQGLVPWQEAHNYLALLFQELLVFVFVLFPSGRFAAHWMRWVFVVLLVMQIPSVFFPANLLLSSTPSSQFGWLLTVVTMVSVAGVQLYRYRWVSNVIERQQTKWVVFGLALPCLYYFGQTVLDLVLLPFDKSSPIYVLAFNSSGYLLSFCLPLAFGFAMLRYHLWNIDSLINRTLVYGSLTAILALVYGGGVIGSQAVVSRFTHGSEQSPLIVVGTTLIIAALFQPLRRYLQALIDRRLFRRKYNAARTLAIFGATLRSRAELETLADDLMAVVDETMQPEHVSLWLSPPDQRLGSV